MMILLNFPLIIINDLRFSHTIRQMEFIQHQNLNLKTYSNENFFHISFLILEASYFLLLMNHFLDLSQLFLIHLIQSSYQRFKYHQVIQAFNCLNLFVLPQKILHCVKNLFIFYKIQKFLIKDYLIVIVHILLIILFFLNLRIFLEKLSINHNL